MILYIQIILMAVLLLILITLYIDEKQKRQAKIPTGKLTHIWDGSERRRFVRISTNVPVRYSLPKNPNDIKISKTKDISTGGICITINEKLIPRARLCLEIEPRESHGPILAKGEVAWVKENTEAMSKEGIRYFDIGIEFKDILPKDKERLFGFVKEFKKA